MNFANADAPNTSMLASPDGWDVKYGNKYVRTTGRATLHKWPLCWIKQSARKLAFMTAIIKLRTNPLSHTMREISTHLQLILRFINLSGIQ